MAHLPKGVYGPHQLEEMDAAYRYARMRTKLEPDIIARRIMLAAGAGIVELERLKAIAARDFRPDIEPNGGTVAFGTSAQRT